MELVFATLAGFALAPLAPLLHRWIGDRFGWVAALGPAGLAGYFAWRVPTIASGRVLVDEASWVSTLGVDLAFRLDGLSLVFALLITVVGALVQIYTGGYLAGDPRAGRLSGLLFAFMAAMLGVVLADDLILLLVFWELTTVVSFLLVGFKHEAASTRSAALQALTVTGAGGLALLAGLVVLGEVAGTYRMSHLAGLADAVRSHTLYPAIAGLVIVGAAAKSAQFPLHSWLSSAMAAPTPVSAYLHSATMVKAGVYLLARLSPVLGGPGWGMALSILGASTMIVGAYIALRQSDYKRVLAYSTISALGTLVLLLGIGSGAAIQAMLVLLLAHGLYKGALFMVAGAVEHETGTRDLDALSGLRRAMPVTAVAAGLAALSLAGLGPLLSFIGKELFFEALLGASLARPVLLVAALLASMMLVAVAGIVGLRPFAGELEATPRRPREPSADLLVGPLVLSVAGLVLGFLPAIADTWLVPQATVAILGAPAEVELTLWHGITPALGLSAVAVAGGIVLHQSWRRLHDVHGWLTRGRQVSGQRVYDQLMTGLQRGAHALTRRVQDGQLRSYVFVVLAALAALLAAGILHGGLPSVMADAGARLETGTAAILVVGGALLAATTGSRMAAVTGLGLAGYGITLVFAFLGAPDLAITQILFETLTVLVFLLVVRNLPTLEVRSETVTRVRDAVLSLGVGLAVFAVVLVATTNGAPSRLADFFGRASYLAAHGRNVVNVILVDFRALDTLGEITVVAAAGAGVYALLRTSGRQQP